MGLHKDHLAEAGVCVLSSSFPEGLAISRSFEHVSLSWFILFNCFHTPNPPNLKYAWVKASTWFQIPDEQPSKEVSNGTSKPATLFLGGVGS